MVEGHYFKIFQLKLCDSLGVAARVVSPAVQRIVVTRDMALVWWLICAGYNLSSFRFVEAKRRQYDKTPSKKTTN
jgi:hypothetical protein